jgi:Fe-S-cluster-containing hydrogenase component 2/bacterioferritin-associated ferredoxin
VQSKLAKEGIIDIAKLKKSESFPSEKRFKEGPVAIIECLEEIPCNPCEFICPEKAIKVGKPIANLPRFFEDKCTGCGLCVPHCPGLAIFIVDLTYSEDEAVVQFPYEFLPLPNVGDEVDAVDREGAIITRAKVKAVRNPKKFNKTPVVSLIVPKKFVMEVRGIKIADNRQQTTDNRQRAEGTKLPAASSQLLETRNARQIENSQFRHSTTTMCRCEEITEDEVMEAIKEGSLTLKGIKDRTRVGMGLCQGRICTKLATQLLSENTDLHLEKIKPPSVRPPVRPIDLENLGAGKEDD